MQSMRECSLEHCARPILAKGLCRAHYLRVRKSGSAGSDPVRHVVRNRAPVCTVDDCANPHASRGLCAKHLSERRRDHQNPGRERRNVSPDVEDRLLPHLDATGPCWEWTRARDEHGYGRLRMFGRYMLAHVAVWEWLVGPVPNGCEIDHLCVNPACCNPDHLEPVTHAENLRRIKYRRYA